MKSKVSPLSNSDGFMNIGMALGVAVVVATFMAPLGLYYLNMFNENEKSRLRTQAHEVVEGLGKMIYNTYASAPTNPSINCPAGEGVDLTRKQVTLGHGQGQNRKLIQLQPNKNKTMAGRVSGLTAGAGGGQGGGGADGGTGGGAVQPVYLCTPTDGQVCQDISGRRYCVDFARMEIVRLMKDDPESPLVADLPVSRTDLDSSLLDRLRWATAPIAAKTAQWMDKNFGESKSVSYSEAYAQAVEVFGATIDSPGMHSPQVTSASFQQARLISKVCHNPSGDPAALGNDFSNHCVSCTENAVVCVRYSMCMTPGSGATTTARVPADCTDPRHFMQGMIAMFPDRI